MKYLLSILIFVFFIGCVNQHKKEVVVIEGCQYFVNAYSILTHKGNCNNPIHWPISFTKYDSNKIEDIGYWIDTIKKSIPTSVGSYPMGVFLEDSLPKLKIIK